MPNKSKRICATDVHPVAMVCPDGCITVYKKKEE